MILDGKISNVAGLIGAAAAGGAFSKLGGGVGAWIGANSRVFGAGLSMLESKIRGRGDDAMQWVSLATSAIFDSGVLQDADGYTLRDNLTAASRQLNWQYVAVHAVGAAIVADRMGEDAALSYIGNAIGSGIANDAYREMGRVTSRTLQLKTLDSAIAAQPHKADELKQLRERVMAGEEKLEFVVKDASEMEVPYADEQTGEQKTRTANALYD